MLNPGRRGDHPGALLRLVPPLHALRRRRAGPGARPAESGFAVRAEAIGAAITPRTRAVLLGYPNNPTGAHPRAELETDRRAGRERHDLVILSDEIYDRLDYDGTHTCFPTAARRARSRTILLGGFSKCSTR